MRRFLRPKRTHTAIISSTLHGKQWTIGPLATVQIHHVDSLWIGRTEDDAPSD